MRLIDANKLINIVNEMPVVSTEPGWFKAAVLLAIVGAPTIELAPVVHGRWIDYKDEHQCSECREFTIVDFYVWKNMPFDYCPNCGAKMDEDGGTC